MTTNSPSNNLRWTTGGWSFFSGGTIYHMQTDGDDLRTAAGERVERFLYTNDSLYYYEDGVIRRINSLIGGLEDDLYFGEIPAAVFNFEVVQDGSKLYYANEEGIVELLLQTPVQASEQKTLLSTDTDVTSLYLAGDMIYYFDASGDLHELDPELAVQSGSSAPSEDDEAQSGQTSGESADESQEGSVRGTAAGDLSRVGSGVASGPMHGGGRGSPFFGSRCDVFEHKRGGRTAQSPP